MSGKFRDMVFAPDFRANGVYKPLVYDMGCFFVGHSDSEKIPGMFGTLTIVLPSLAEGVARETKTIPWFRKSLGTFREPP